MLPLISKIYGKNPKPRNWSKGTYGFRIVDTKIVLFKNKILGLPLGKKLDLKIPDIFCKNKLLTKRFLRGFFSTDGSFIISLVNNKKYPRLFMSSISEKLMIQIKKVLINMGFIVSFWEGKQVNPNWKLQYKIHLNGFEMLSKWNEEIGFNNPKQVKKMNELII